MLDRSASHIPLRISSTSVTSKRVVPYTAPPAVLLPNVLELRTLVRSAASAPTGREPQRQGKALNVGASYADSGAASGKQNPAVYLKNERIAKVMAAAGVASRRACEVLIAAGKVKLNNAVVTTPATLVDVRKDKIVVEGKLIKVSGAPKHHYFAVNKPKGYICSNVDTKGGKRVVDLLQPWLENWKEKNKGEREALPPRLFTVGRLDVNTIGLILVTSDGDWAQRVIHPSANITKEYIATLMKPPTAAQLRALAQGTVVEGVPVVPEVVEVVEGGGSRWSKVRVIVKEGRKHEVRELVAAAGCELQALKRTRVGGLRLPADLPLGKYKSLSAEDVKAVVRDPLQQQER